MKSVLLIAMALAITTFALAESLYLTATRDGHDRPRAGPWNDFGFEGRMKKAAKRAAGLHRASLAKLHDLDAALELMYYGWRGMTLTADQYLATLGLSRPHHRILYIVARQPDISIGALIDVLGISKQALNRPLNLLLQHDLLTSTRSVEQHRTKLLRLTPEGKRIEQRASGYERKVLRAAFDHVGETGAAAWMAVMGAIADNN
jgi:DNA-binding MarR family transcriptional regulator